MNFMVSMWNMPHMDSSLKWSLMKRNFRKIPSLWNDISLRRYQRRGSALAARIVRKFKDDTLRIIDEEPERLAEVKGISEKKAREIAEQVAEKSEMRSAMMFLQQYGISVSLGVKIYGNMVPVSIRY